MSWAAAAFTSAWAIFHGQWWLAALLFAIFAGTTVAAGWLGLGEGWMALSQIIIAIGFGAEAHNIERWTLRLRGFDEIATVSGDSPELAELTFFASQAAVPGNESRPVSRHVTPPDTLGLFGNV
jgi:hypothetical protein